MRFRHLLSIVSLILTAASVPSALARQEVMRMPEGCRDFGRLSTAALEGSTASSLDALLLQSAAAGCPDVIEAALAGGASLTARDRAGNSALLTAVIKNRNAAVERLLQAGADPNAANGRGLLPLSAAVYKGDAALVTMLLRAGARNDIADEICQGVRGPMVFAAQHGDSAVVASLLDSGVDVNARYKHGMTALMFAAGNGNEVVPERSIETAKLLLARGADLEAVDVRGRSALLVAAQRNNPEIVKLLLERGADPLRLDLFGNTALELTDDERVIEELGLAMKAAGSPSGD